MSSVELAPCMGGVAFLSARPVGVYGDSHDVAVLQMIKSERELLRAFSTLPRQPCQTEVSHLPWFRHHRTQSFHAETHFESPTDTCVLLVQLRLRLRQLVQRFGTPPTEILFAPTLERFLMIAARCFEALILDCTICLFRYWPCTSAPGLILSGTSTTTKRFETSSRRSSSSGSPSAMMSSP